MGASAEVSLDRIPAACRIWSGSQLAGAISVDLILTHTFPAISVDLILTSRKGLSTEFGSKLKMGGPGCTGWTKTWAWVEVWVKNPPPPAPAPEAPAPEGAGKKPGEPGKRLQDSKKKKVNQKKTGKK